MAQDSKIEWTDHTANIWWGCTKVHAGCDNCYAEKQSNRWDNDLWGNDKPRKVIKGFFSDLGKFQKLAKAAGTMHRVFVGSMMDIFEKPMPLVDSKDEPLNASTADLRELFFQHITDGAYPNLLFLLLTKRPSNINKYIPESWKENPPANVMFGTSPVDQETFDTLVPQLMKVNGKRFLSVEPQLGELTLKSYCPKCSALLVGSASKTCGSCHGQTMLPNWIICGGESGPGRRTFNPYWGRSLRDQCEAAGVPFFFKQIDKVIAIPEDLMIRQFSTI